MNVSRRTLFCVLTLFGLSALSSAQTSDAALAEDAATVRVDSTKSASVPRTVRYSGVLRGADGAPRTGVAAVTFAFYNEAQGGSPLYLETQNVQLDEQGRYAVLLGATSREGLPRNLFATGEARWLGVRVAEEGAAEQARVALVSVPYALASGDAQSLGGRPVTDFQLTRAAAEASGETQAAGVETSGTVSSGANTVNRVAKFTGVDTVGDSSLFDNGNVGIGTTSPSSTLHVKGTGAAYLTLDSSGANTLDRGIRFLDQAGNAAAFLIATPNTVGTNSALNFYVGGATSNDIRLSINNNGNVGYGTLNPSSPLHVKGTGTNYIIIDSSGANNLDRGMRFLNQTGFSAGLIALQPNTLGVDTRMDFYVGGAALSDVRLALLNNGNVGIGTTAPTAPLHVKGTGSTYLTIDSSGANSLDRGLLFLNQAGSPAGYLTVTPNTVGANARMDLYVGGGAGSDVKMSLLNNGNVGIGTSAPSQKLEVAGTIYSTTGGFKFPDGSTQLTAATGGGAGDITAVIAGTGLSGGATTGDATLSVNTAVVQSRITGTCASGNYVRVINQDGSVTCGTDQTGAGGIVYPYSSGDQNTASGAFKVIQTNSVVLGTDPTFSSAQSGIPAGVVGVASATSNTAAGVAGFTSSANGVAVVGWNGSTTGSEETDASGVLGVTDNNAGVGVTGEAHAATGFTRGVEGRSASSSGIGVRGRADSTTGSTTGIVGEVVSPNGVAGYFFAPAGTTSFLLRGGNGGPDIFKVDGNGTVFAAAYKDLNGNPIGGGSGDITDVTAGSGLTGGGTSGSVSLAVDATVARTNANNNFTTSQNITGALTATGVVTAAALVSDTVDGGVLGRDTDPADTYPRVGVQGIIKSPRGSGVSGISQSTTGLTSGVSGTTASDNGAGVYGVASATTGFTAGMRGIAMSASGNGVRGDMMSSAVGAAIAGGNGVLGSYGLNQDFTNNANATGGIGVIGLNFAPGGTGIQGEATGTGSTIGLYAKATSSTGTAAVLNNAGGGTILRAQNNGAEKFRVDGSGDVVVNGGDLAAIVQGKGIVLRSTNGTKCFRLTVDDSGTLATAEVTCPN